jgi:hypothetical protein
MGLPAVSKVRESPKMVPLFAEIIPAGLSFASVSFLFCSLHLSEQYMGFLIALRYRWGNAKSFVLAHQK